MTNQFDLEQSIMGCWNVTSDLDVLFEELVENGDFDKDKASNFVLGLSTIYQAKFDKLFRTFEGFLKHYYSVRNELEETKAELDCLHDDIIRTASEVLDATYPVDAEEAESLAALFDEEESKELALVEDDAIRYSHLEEADAIQEIICYDEEGRPQF